ncbi:MAG: T9SS type A sorting domain-containing protein, partial [Candidatus Cloacimonetes bacterium]|nr:T9SS type A sorting domain-containing protein [Candidatus Cloacimonadota bacterium]
IHYQLPEDIDVELIIYNIKGQFVKVLVNDFQNAGEHSFIWDGTDQYRNPVSSGVYLYRLKSDEGVLMSKKMLLLK